MRMFRRARTLPMPDRLATQIAWSVRRHGGGRDIRLGGGAAMFAGVGASGCGDDAALAGTVGLSGADVTLGTGAGVTDGPGAGAADGPGVEVAVAGPIPFRQLS
jgi:hypothetical protein